MHQTKLMLEHILGVFSLFEYTLDVLCFSYNSCLHTGKMNCSGAINVSLNY